MHEYGSWSSRKKELRFSAIVQCCLHFEANRSTPPKLRIFEATTDSRYHLFAQSHTHHRRKTFLGWQGGSYPSRLKEAMTLASDSLVLLPLSLVSVLQGHLLSQLLWLLRLRRGAYPMSLPSLVHPDDRLLVLLASHSPRNRNVGETQGACGGDIYAKGQLKPREGPLPKVPQKTGG